MKIDPAVVPEWANDEGIASWERFFASLSPEDQATIDGLAELDRTYGPDFEREARDRTNARPR